MTTLLPVPKARFFSASGAPLAGGKVYTYSAGTTTPKNTYTDASGAVANANPVILDSAGEADIWLLGNYKIILKNSADVQQWSVDNVSGGAAVSIDWLTVTGTDTLIATPAAAVTAYTNQQIFLFYAVADNTGPVTINISGLGAKNLVKNGSTALAAGDIATGMFCQIVYDGTNFQYTSVRAGTMAKQNADAVAITGGTATLNNTGLSIKDTDATHALGIVPGSNLTANRTLTVTTGDANRTVTLSGNLTVSADANISGTNTGDTAAATQAEMEAASSTTVMVTPGRQKYHPGSAKGWVHFAHITGTPTIREAYNVSSLTDNGTGDTTANFTTSFSNTTFATVGNYNVNLTTDPNSNTGQVLFSSLATGSVRINTYNVANSALDCSATWAVFFGDQ